MIEQRGAQFFVSLLGLLALIFGTAQRLLAQGFEFLQVGFCLFVHIVLVVASADIIPPRGGGP
jgi:uncharacterized membrane protein